MNEQFFQDYIRNNNCFGCAPGNPHGFRIKSSWRSADEAVCKFTPHSYHCARSVGVVNGGVIATIVDCHCICTAIADAYAREDKKIGEGNEISYVTAAMNIDFVKPIPMGSTLLFVAKVQEVTPKRTSLLCTVEVADVLYAKATITAVRISR